MTMFFDFETDHDEVWTIEANVEPGQSARITSDPYYSSPGYGPSLEIVRVEDERGVEVDMDEWDKYHDRMLRDGYDEMQRRAAEWAER